MFAVFRRCCEGHLAKGATRRARDRMFLRFIRRIFRRRLSGLGVFLDGYGLVFSLERDRCDELMREMVGLKWGQ